VELGDLMIANGQPAGQCERIGKRLDFHIYPPLGFTEGELGGGGGLAGNVGIS